MQQGGCAASTHIKHTRTVGFYSEVHFDCSPHWWDPILLSAVTNYFFFTAFGIIRKHTGATRQLCGVGSLLPLRVLEIAMQQVLSPEPPYQLLEMFPIKKGQSESTFVNIYSLELKKACISTLYSLAKLHRN